MRQEPNKQAKPTPLEELYEKNTPSLSLEKAIIKAGNAHTYQKRLILLFGVQWMLCSMVFCVNNYLFQHPIDLCSNKNTEPFVCTDEQACSGEYEYGFSEQSPASLTTEFSLICGQASYQDLGESAIFLGAIIGSLYYADIQTRKGRLFALYQTMSLAGFALMASVLSFNIIFNIVALFLVNFGTFAFMNTSLPFFMEISSENLRLFGPNIFFMFWALGQIMMSIVLSITTSWRLISFGVLGVPFFITAFFFQFVKDSPRYLVHLKRFGDAKVSIQNMAKINERPLPDYKLAEEHLDIMSTYSPGHEQSLLDEDKTKSKPRTIFTLFKYPSLKKPCWCLCAIYVLLSIPHQGNLIALTHFSNDGPQSLMTCGIIELFSYIISAYCCLNFRRKMILKTTFVCIGSVYILFLTTGQIASEIDIHHSDGFSILLLLIGRISTSVGFATLNIYITEVIPTSVRHFAYALYTAVTSFAYIFLDNFIISMRSAGFHPQFCLGVIIICLCTLLLIYLKL